MKIPFTIVYSGGTGEIIEKKSRFIATVIPIQTEEEALLFIEQMKKKHYNASHNCSAYVLGQNNEVERCSDDGEPSKTAGRPMLDVLLGEGIHNTAVVVTRYFGGTLLGTGGLIRAYQSALKEALSHCVITTKLYGKQFLVTTTYTEIGKLLYLSETMKFVILDTQYTELVNSRLLVLPEEVTIVLKKIQEATNGQAQVEELNPISYAFIDEKIVLFTES